MHSTVFSSIVWRRIRTLFGIVSAVILANSCSSDITETQRANPGPIMPVTAGPGEYNLIDPDGPADPCQIEDVPFNVCEVDINGGIWQFPVPFQVGTGNLNPFWDTHNSPTSECFNTDANTLPLNCARSAWTNALPLNVVPVFFFTPEGGAPVLVRELVWDMNEPNSTPEVAQVSIDFFRVYLCAEDLEADPPIQPNLFSTEAQVEANCDKVYSIEDGGIDTGDEGTGLAWDGSTQGSGNALDYRILIPESFFEAANQAGVDSCPYDPAGEDCDLYVIVWAHLGGKGAAWITTGGFEEMSTVERPVPAKKSGVKFHDLDADGNKDAGEPGLPGWTIYVDLDDDGVHDGGEPSDVTDATGAYQIVAIPEGTWKVKEVGQAGWTCSYPSPCYHEEDFEDGDVLTGNDFGNWTTASKAGVKFEDLDKDGQNQEAGEPGLSGWTIFVDYDDDGVLDAGEPSAVTAAGGAYTITGITPGTWKVKEVLQAGWTCSYPNPNCYHQETFTSGAALTGNNFGNWRAATKSGLKFEDLDKDGQNQEAGEPGLAGWTIFVDYDDDGVLDAGEPSAVTGAGGAYTITGINPGTWKVKEVLQAGWTCSYPTPNCYHQETFTSGASLTANNFGNWTTAAKSGVKFEDLDKDGQDLEAGEPGLAGWTIFVDYDDDGVLDAGEPSAVTDASGAYSITGVNPGTWKVREVLQAGWTCSYPNPNCYHQETFQSGVPLTGNNFGNWRAATKAGVKFEDLDRDGQDQEAGEPGLSGWTIFVDYDDDGVLDAGEPSAVTGAGGAYTITGINPGTWKVREVLQAGWTCSYPNPNCYHQETFTSGAALTGNNFGNWRAATKSGIKFEDLDADGQNQEAGEPGLAGWTIYVDYDDDGVLDAGEPSAVTGAGGAYTITGINPGTWKVREVLQAGWTCSYPNPNCYHQETFTSGASLTANNFGNWRPTSKSGVKFEDLDADGQNQEAGEPGLAGWTIYVDYDGDGVLDAGEPSAVTGAGGSYTITGIVPGTWKVREVPQAGWTCTFPATSDAFGCYHQELFQSGIPQTGNNFGNAQPRGAVLLIIDEDGIDNGLRYNATGGPITPDGPNFFTPLEVNDDKPGHTQRDVLRYFAQHVGQTITVVTGQTGDEGWFAPNCIPQKWISGGSNTCLTGASRQTAIDNYFGVNGPGVIPPQSQLDKIPWVLPLRALGLNSLVGKDVCAVVYDSDISINYDLGKPLGVNGNLQGETLGIVAFHVNETRTLNGFSSSTLPEVQITILSPSVCGNWVLFNAPVPASSSVPNDRVAPGSPAGYYALKVWAALPLFY